RDRHHAGQHTVLVVEDLERAGVFGLGRGAFIAARDQDRQPVVGRDAHLMREDPASIEPGCFTSSPGVKSGLIRYTRNALGLLNATRMFSEGMSVVMWIGRVGSRIASPCLVRAPLAGAARDAGRRA